MCVSLHECPTTIAQIEFAALISLMLSFSVQGKTGVLFCMDMNGTELNTKSGVTTLLACSISLPVLELTGGHMVCCGCAEILGGDQLSGLKSLFSCWSLYSSVAVSHYLHLQLYVFIRIFLFNERLRLLSQSDLFKDVRSIHARLNTKKVHLLVHWNVFKILMSSKTTTFENLTL